MVITSKYSSQLETIINKYSQNHIQDLIDTFKYNKKKLSVIFNDIFKEIVIYWRNWCRNKFTKFNVQTKKFLIR